MGFPVSTVLGFGCRADYIRWSNPLRNLGKGSGVAEDLKREALNFLLIWHVKFHGKKKKVKEI